MKSARVVMTSTAPMLDGSTIAREALIDGARQVNEYGLPTLASHDQHRLLGWIGEAWVEENNGTSYLVGIQEFPETRDEFLLIQARHRRLQDKRLREYREQAGDELEKLYREAPDAQFILSGSGLGIRSPGIVMRTFPELFKRVDRDGLIDYSDLESLSTGVYQIGDICILAHKGFRRNFSRFNSFNIDLFKTFNSLLEDNANDFQVKIAIDPDLITHPTAIREPVELAYWWGPKFSDDLSSIPPGVTIHGNDRDDQLYHLLSRTEFFWYSRDNEHVLEIEELMGSPNVFDEDSFKYGTRYLHSIVDEETNRIIHCDGAAKFYNEDEYAERDACKIPEAQRSSRYEKLWRLYGYPKLEDWKAIIHDFFRDNNTIAEYFGISDDHIDSRKTTSYYNIQ